MKKFILLAVLAAACGGVESDIEQTQSASTTAALYPTANVSGNKFTGTYAEIDDTTCDNNTTIVYSDATEEGCWTIGGFGAAVPTGALMVEIQVTSCAKRRFSGTSHLQMGYAFDSAAITWGGTINLGSSSYASPVTNLSTSTIKASQTLKVCAKDTDGNGINISRVAVAVKYVAVPGSVTLTVAHNNAAKTELLMTTSWAQVADNQGYRLECSLDGSVWTLAANVATNVTTGQHIVSPNVFQVPQCRVKTKYGAGESSPSSVVKGLSAPTSLETTFLTENAGLLSWQLSAAGGTITGTQIQHSTDEVNWNNTSLVSAPDEDFVITDIPRYYRAWAVGANLVSVRSNSEEYIETPVCNLAAITPDGCTFEESFCNENNNLTTINCTSMGQVFEYSENGTAWFTVGGSPTNLTDHVASPDAGHPIRYRVFKAWNGLRSEYLEYEGWPKPENFDCVTDYPTVGTRTCYWDPVSGLHEASGSFAFVHWTGSVWRVRAVLNALTTEYSLSNLTSGPYHVIATMGTVSSPPSDQWP